MLEDKLQTFWKSGKFATSWIISSHDLEASLIQIKNFAQTIMNAGNLPIANNPDFLTVQKEETKSITISQVRELQSFLSTTKAVSDYKFAVIMEADLMNNNSQNCCLKILEEPPKNTFLFLLSKEPTNLSATIKSRCHKLNLNNGSLERKDDSYSEFIDKISTSNTNKKISYLKDISTKAKESDWEAFCKNSLNLILSLHKHNLDPNFNLNNEESRYLESRGFLKKNLGQRVEKVQTLIRDEEKFDLDKKHIGILILECLD